MVATNELRVLGWDGVERSPGGTCLCFGLGDWPRSPCVHLGDNRVLWWIHGRVVAEQHLIIGTGYERRMCSIVREATEKESVFFMATMLASRRSALAPATAVLGRA